MTRNVLSRTLLFVALHLIFVAPQSSQNNTQAADFDRSSQPQCKQMRYNRKEWNFRGYKFSLAKGYYSQKKCQRVCAGSKRQKVEADHLVSLRDAHASGGCSWNPQRKKNFANDLQNLVPACGCINAMKSSHPPADFIRLSADKRGIDFLFRSKQVCAYLDTYARIKKKYQLSFANNDMDLFDKCGL